MNSKRNSFYYQMVKDAYHRMKYYFRVASKRDVYYPLDIKIQKELIGDREAPWCVGSDMLDKSSIVYSFGAGTNISFDTRLIDKFGCKVFAFDPTPRSIQWIKKQTLPSGFLFMEYGVSDRDGVILFYPPANPDHVSYSTETNIKSNQGIELPVYRLKTIMNKLGHDKVDLLKMDIEGSEYCVLHDIIDSGIEVKQIMVEFHHRFDHIPMEKTKEAINALRSKGFKIYYVSPSGEEYSFVK